MAELWTAFYNAWEVLALGAIVAVLIVHTKAGAATGLALIAYIPMLADAGALTFPANVALPVVHTVSGSTSPAIGALLVVLAYARATASREFGALLVVLTLLVDAPLDWMRRRGIRRCRSCWGCLHDGEL